MKNILNRLFNYEILTQRAAFSLMDNIIEGKYNSTQIASLLTVYQMRSISPDEILGFREALLSRRISVDLSQYQTIDIVGTGGDGKNTFNISTCACFVVAAAGYCVAKHGNYSATSVSGASNVMEYFGVKFTNDEEKLRRSIDETNMAYLHAPLFNPSLKAVAPVRKDLQIRTIFNLLGPLVNPSLPSYQLLGVANLSQMRLYTQALQQLGLGFLVVNSFDGYDEISLTSDFKITTNQYEKVYSPHDLGLEKASQSQLYGGETVQDAAEIFSDVLTGKAHPMQTQSVMINAAFAIQAIENEKSIQECICIAQRVLENRKAYQTFKKFVKINS